MSGTSDSALAGRPARLLDAACGALQGAGFAAAVLGALATSGLATLALLAWPPSGGALAAFAEEFRRWCFGREAAGLDGGLLALSVSGPLVLSGVVLAFWGRALREGLAARPGRVLAVAAASCAAVALAGVALFATQRDAAAGMEGPLPFPGRAIRTAVPAPDVVLPDHRGATTSMADLRGRVVVVTAVYARCSTACPMILAESHALLAALSPAERDQVTLVAITLDPEHDTRERLAEIARGHSLQGDVRLLTGPAADVERALDRFGFERRRDPATGRIDHAGFFALVDRDGRIAYRLSASSSQPHWLPDAVRALVAEGAAPPPVG